jgi:hypothetical protein
MNDPTVSALPTATVFAGIDWASTDHAVCVIDAAGAVLWRHTVAHSRAGLARLTARLSELGVGRVGIERPDGPVVEALLDAGLRVAVVPPRQVKNLRSRYGRTGKDDRFDAYVLADAMRTDGHRFTDLARDSAETTGLRALVRARQDLVEVRVGLVNQLRHTLELAFPGAIGLFCELHSPIARAFLRRFPTAAEAAVLDEETMTGWLAAEGYPGRTTAGAFIDRLRSAPASSGPPRCWPRSAMPAAATRTPKPSPRPPASARSPTNPANTAPSVSATRSTPSCAGRSPTSPMTPATPTRGRPTSTRAPEPVGCATHTQSASWPAPGPW